ncbi:MAG: hypothetical protein ACM30I_17960 [Gemmatimonas sp.]
MRMFMIDAYGGAAGTDGGIHHFGVQAETAEEARELVRSSATGERFTRFDVVEIGDEFEGDEAEIVAEAEGPYGKPA